MRRRTLAAAVLCAGAMAASACATGQSRMARALDPSMERVQVTEGYIRAVAGITGDARRLMRGDGYVYLADVAPQLRYLAVDRDTARYRSLRTYVQEKLLRRDATGLTPERRYRSDVRFEPATAYGYQWLGEALRDGWRLLGDTASAQLLAQIAWSGEDMQAAYASTYGFTMRCADAVDEVQQSPATGRAVLAKAVRDLQPLQVRGQEYELDVLSCMTRLAVAARDPDATVRYLDRVLDLLEPLVRHSGRPDGGTSADVLLTLRAVREVGPRYYDRR